MTPDTRARLALLAMPKMGPARVSWLLASSEAPAVVEAVRAGRLPVEVGEPPPGVTRDTIRSWQTEIRQIDTRIDEIQAATTLLGAEVLSPLDPDWPLADDPEPPGLLFAVGDLDLLSVPTRVAVVGTRRCTALGRTVAYQLGSDLAVAGAGVVSGLALGVDGAAHRGCLDLNGPAIGVVASGLDVVYPRANRSLWDEVTRTGLLLSEVPTTVKPDRWRFPARNRLIAALSHGVIVVESHQRGGALSTADEALRRDLPVMVVPGSVLSPASRGTNALLVDGAVPVRDAVDVLTYLGHPIPNASVVGSEPDAADPASGPAGADGDAGDSSGSGSEPRSDVVVEFRPRPDPAGAAPSTVQGWPPGSVGHSILAEVAAGSAHLDQLVLVTGLSVADVLATVQELQAAGLVEVDGSTVILVGPRP